MHTSRLSQKHANTSYERPIERPTSMAVALANGMAWPWPWPLRESHWTHWPSNASPLVAHWAPIERPLSAHWTLIYLALIVIANAHWAPIQCPMQTILFCALSFATCELARFCLFWCCFYMGQHPKSSGVRCFKWCTSLFLKSLLRFPSNLLLFHCNV